MTRVVMSKRYQHLWFVASFVAVMGVLSWLLVGESSPFHSYFIHNVGLPNVWRTVHIPALLLSVFASGNVHQGNEAVFILGFILQWSVVGLAISLLFRRLSHTDDDHAA